MKRVKRVHNGVGTKLIVIVTIVLVLMIPMPRISLLISERSSRRGSVEQEIAQTWGGEQTFWGPMLRVSFRPYTTMNMKEGDSVVTKRLYKNKETAIFLPQKYHSRAEIVPTVKSRGIYDITLFSTDISFDARFDSLDFTLFSSDSVEVDWGSAELILGISDMTGIAGDIVVNHGEKPCIFSPERQGMGVSASLNLTGGEKEIVCAGTVPLRGSSSIAVTPVGTESTIEMNSSWKSPSFFGKRAPESSVTNGGFEAAWRVPSYVRSFPSQWIAMSQAKRTRNGGSELYRFGGESVGVRLIPAVDQYLSVQRSAKYAFLFISLTFLSLFLVEVLRKRTVHPIQYLLIGVALVLFYSLLLSFSEQIGFTPAYVIAAVASIALMSSYMKAILQDALSTGILTGVLFSLYSYLFITLNQEEYALLMGSLGLFTILGTVMFTTRKIDWYGENREEEEEIL